MFTFDVKMSFFPHSNKINYIAYKRLCTYSLALIEAHGHGQFKFTISLWE